jgi:hypothetical protein
MSIVQYLFNISRHVNEHQTPPIPLFSLPIGHLTPCPPVGRILIYGPSEIRMGSICITANKMESMRITSRKTLYFQ